MYDCGIGMSIVYCYVVFVVLDRYGLGDGVWGIIGIFFMFDLFVFGFIFIVVVVFGFVVVCCYEDLGGGVCRIC